VCKQDNGDECLDALVARFAYTMSRAAARGGLDGAPGLPALAIGGIGFVAGLLAAAIVALLFGQQRTRRELRQLRPQRSV
jgi:hypothetical protein